MSRELQEKRLLLAEINLALDARRNDAEVLEKEKRRVLDEINHLVIEENRPMGPGVTEAQALADIRADRYDDGSKDHD